MSQRIIESFPQTRDLPVEVVRLGLVSRIFSGGTPDKSREAFWDGDLPWLGSGSVNQRYIVEPTAHITAEAVAKSSTRLFPKDSLTMALAGQGKTKAMIARLGINAYGNQSMACIDAYKGEVQFLFWWLQSIYKEIRALSSEDTRDGLNQSIVGQLPVPLFDLPTQKRIAAFLDRETARIDELIAKKERLFQLLTEHLRASFDGLFLEGIATHAAFTSLPFHWMPRLPASWTLTKLKYLGEKGQKTTQMGPFGGMLTQLLQTDTGFKLYGQENTISRDFSKGSRWVSEATFRELSRYELKPGDIMLTRKGTLGKCASFPSGAVRGIADSDTIRIRLNHSLFSHWMLENTLQYASYVSEQIALEKRGAILAGLNTSIIDNLLIAVPPMNEQQKIAAFGTKMLEKNSSLRESLISSIDRLKEYRAALITAAVTGQINVDTYGKTGTTSATLDKIEEEMQA